MTAIIKVPDSKDWIVRDSDNGQDYEIHVDSYQKAQELANKLTLEKLEKIKLGMK